MIMLFNFSLWKTYQKNHKYRAIENVSKFNLMRYLDLKKSVLSQLNEFSLIIIINKHYRGNWIPFDNVAKKVIKILFNMKPKGIASWDSRIFYKKPCEDFCP